MKRGTRTWNQTPRVAHWFTGTLRSQVCTLIQWGHSDHGLHIDSLGHPDHGLLVDSLGHPDHGVARWLPGARRSWGCTLIPWDTQIMGLHVDFLGHPDHELHTDSLGHPDHGVAHQSLAISTILMMLVDCLWARNCSVSPLLCWVYIRETKFVLLY